MKFDLRRTRPRHQSVLWWILGGLAFLVGLGTILVGNDVEAVQKVDDSVAQWAFDRTVSTESFEFWRVVSYVLHPWTLRFALLGLAAAAFAMRVRRGAVWLVLTVVAETIIAPASKFVLDRPRSVWDEPLFTESGYSFPSGHAAAAGMFSTALILITLVMTRRGSLKRRALLLLWIAMAVVGAAGRLFLGVHYLSDVVVGTALGAFITFGLWLIVTLRVPDEIRSDIALMGSGNRKLAVIYNPIKIGDLQVFKQRILAVSQREGWTEPLWLATTKEDPGTGQAHRALEAGADLVIAAGGDGTVRVVCDEMARTGIAVGILPHGTGNLLARNLGIPLNIIEAIEVVFTGGDRAIDLVSYHSDAAPDTSFLVMAGLGMDAAIMTGAPDQLKKKVGWAAYILSGAKSLRFPAMKISIQIDDGEWAKFRARTVVIGNVGYLQAGFPLLPDAELDDGVIDVVVLAPKRILGWLAIGVRIIGRQKRTNARLDRMTGKKVVIRAERPAPMQLDGDPVGEATELTAEVRPGVLLLRAPKR
ncbi:hypothetical protein BH09ACT10_BH09ACT10_10880 [soil metagenome]